MATTTYQEVWAFAAAFGGYGAAETVEVPQPHIYPYPSIGGASGSLYVNKVWDTTSGGWIFWTTEFEDVDGRFYPGPGAWGVNTSRYRVEMITFAEQ
jgi:hypothetical protein